jgi:hypothetical protein
MRRFQVSYGEVDPREWMISLQNSILEKRSRRGKPSETKPSELRNASNAMMIQKHTPECALVSGNILKAREIEIIACPAK